MQHLRASYAALESELATTKQRKAEAEEALEIEKTLREKERAEELGRDNERREALSQGQSQQQQEIALLTKQVNSYTYLPIHIYVHLMYILVRYDDMYTAIYSYTTGARISVCIGTYGMTYRSELLLLDRYVVLVCWCVGVVSWKVSRVVETT